MGSFCRVRNIFWDYKVASQEKIRELTSIAERLEPDTLDEQKLVRRTLGEESLEEALLPLLKKIRHKAIFSIQHAKNVPEGHVENVRQHLDYIVSECEAQAARNNQDFIAHKEAFLQNIQSYFEGLKESWIHFVSAAVEERGLLTDEGIHTRYSETLQEMNRQSGALLDKLKGESNEAIENARKLADEIEARARKTAEKISVQEAQNQFKEAQNPLVVQLVLWGGLSIVSIVVFFWLLYQFMKPELNTTWTWQVVYFSGLRLAALGAVASLGAYCLGILRSQLHLFQRNLHRQRIANCIEAFVQSASTPEQRDFIYSRLVEAIIKFGDTGLVKGTENDRSTTKLMIDNLSRSISSPKVD